METIGLISLAGKVDKTDIKKAKSNIEKLGYNVKLSPNIYCENRYLAGTDEDRINSLYEFLLDDEIDIIMSTRGGYGSIRLINELDYDLIKKHPKKICGYSDITALLLMIYKKTGLNTYHGPMAISDFVEPNEYTVEKFSKVINGESIDLEGDKIYKSGDADGILWGGNLSTVVSLCGLDFIPEEEFIFFTEDLNEPVYKIDKMFQQLINIKRFKKYCKGVVLGDFLDVDKKEWLETLFCEISEKLAIPVIGGFKFTHDIEKCTIPIGKKANLNRNLLKIHN